MRTCARRRVTVTTDGEWIGATGANDKGASLVRIWNAQNRTLIAELTVSTKPVMALAFSPDKRWLAVHVVQEPVSVWNLETRKREAQFPVAWGNNFGVGTVRFSPDGKTLATGDNGLRVRLIDVQSWTEKAALPERFSGGGVMTLDYSPDGRFLAAGAAYLDPRIFVSDTKTNKRIATLEGHHGFIADVKFSPDGKTLASASGDQTIKLWNTDTWQEVDTLLGHTDEVWSVNFSSGGDQLVSSGKDGFVYVWSASARRYDRESITLPPEPTRPRILPDVSPDGKTIVVVSNAGTVRLLETGTLRERSVPGEIGTDNVAAFWLSPSEILIGATSPARIKSWNLSNNVVATYPLKKDHPEVALEFSSASNLVVVTTVTRWDTLSRRELSSYAVADRFGGLQKSTLSQDGQWLAFATEYNVEVRNIATGQTIPAFRRQSKGIQGLALLSGQHQVVTAGSAAPIINVWDFTTQQKLRSLAGQNLVIGSIAVSPDEKRMASRPIGLEPIRLWDTQSWNEVARLEARPGYVIIDHRILPDGNTISGLELSLESQVTNVRLWRAPTWEEINAAEAKEKAEIKQQ